MEAQVRIYIDWKPPLFSFYRGENLLLEVKVWMIHFEWWHREARP